MKAYKHLIKFALSCKYTVSVWDGEEWQVKHSSKYQEIVDAVESVEEAELTIRDGQNNKMGWALVAAFGLEDDETVMDNTLTCFMEDWDKAYSETQGS
jgi:hypothetical protein